MEKATIKSYKDLEIWKKSVTLATDLTIAFNLNYISNETHTQLFDKTEELSKMINSLIRKLDQSTL